MRGGDARIRAVAAGGTEAELANAGRQWVARATHTHPKKKKKKRKKKKNRKASGVASERFLSFVYGHFIPSPIAWRMLMFMWSRVLLSYSS